jgi:elongator complex protein 1
LISDFTASNPEIVQDAIKYIIFLTNVNHLYDVALGMYDFQLVLMVAQYSQKVDLSFVFPYHRVSMHPLTDYVPQDPKEYLPFLRELRALEKDYQRYRIDDHLERWERALGHLHAGGKSPRCRSGRI